MPLAQIIAMRLFLRLLAAGGLVVFLAGCAGTPPASRSARPSSAARSQSFEAMAEKLHSPALMARVLYREARERKDEKRAVMAALFAIRARDNALARRAAALVQELSPNTATAYQIRLRVALDVGAVGKARMNAAQAYQRGGAAAINSILNGPVDPWLAYAVLRPLAAKNREDELLQLMLARAALQAGDNGVALRVARGAQNSQGAPAHLIAIQALWSLGKHKAALAHGAEVLAAHSHDVGLRIFYAGLLARAGHYARAREVLGDARALAPRNMHVTLAYALVDVAEGKDSAARDRLTRILESGGDSAGAYSLLGRLAVAQGHWAEAFGWYASTDDPAFLGSSGVAATFALEQWKGLDTAEHYLRHLQAIAPALAPTWAAAEATLLDNAGRHRDAYRLLTKLAKRYTVVRPLRYQRALLADTLGKSDVALGILKKLVAEEPENFEYLNAYGYALTEHTHDYRKAYAYIKRALSADPGNGAILDSMGWVLYRLGRSKEALSYLRRAWGETGDPEVAGHLVTVCIALGRHAEATRVLRAALAKAPDSSVLQRLKKRLAR